MEKTATKTADPALEILLRKLEEAKARNPRLSLRAFAQKLGLSSGTLSELLNGKRPFSMQIKRRVADKLILSPKENAIFFQNELPERMAAVDHEQVTLSQDQFRLISDWWYFALLSLAKTKNFKNQIAWMARRLGISVAATQEAWSRLFRMGFLAQEGEDVVHLTPNLKTSDGLIDLSVRKSHLADLELMEKSLMEIPQPLRDHTSETFVIRREDLPKAKEMIRLFRAQFLNQLSRERGEGGDEVYKLTVALYPLTQVTGEQ